MLLQSLPPTQVSDVELELSQPQKPTGPGPFRQDVMDGAGRQPCSECPV